MVSSRNRLQSETSFLNQLLSVWAGCKLQTENESMADKHVDSISLKALVDKNNRVVFAESDVDFIDVLFSFLTMPMGTIVRLTRNQPPAVDIGCMNNLYRSVKNFDVQRLHTEACKTVLLCPRNGAETHCRNLKLKIDIDEPISSKGAMSQEKKMVSAIQDRGVFVKGLTRLLVSDKLEVMPPSTAASLSLLSEIGVMDGSTIEDRTFDIGTDKVLNLLKCSLVSKTPLTEALLKHEPVPQLIKKDFNQGSSIIQSQLEPEASKGDGKIRVKIIVSKSRNMVCYAEAQEDFVDLLFSFLTLPLGYILKKMQGSSSSKGCIDQLYTSVNDLDAEYYMKLDEHKELLVSPKVAPGYRYENQPLGIEEASHPYYRLTIDERFIPSENLTVIDPKLHYKEATNDGGFVEGPAMFIITDNLVIKPVSQFSGKSVLYKLKVPRKDVEEQIVHVGNEEALRLLVASFVSESALTNAFIPREPNHE